MCRQAQAELESEGTVEATSAREEKEMQALLEMFAMGVGAVDEFQAKLQEELSALEVCPEPVCVHCAERCLRLVSALPVFSEYGQGVRNFPSPLASRT